MKQLEDELSELGGEMKVVCARLFQYLPKTTISAVCVPHGAAAIDAVCSGPECWQCVHIRRIVI